MIEWEVTYLDWFYVNGSQLTEITETLYCDTIEMLIQNLSVWNSHEVIAVSDNELIVVANFGDMRTRRIKRVEETQGG